MVQNEKERGRGIYLLNEKEWRWVSTCKGKGEWERGIRDQMMIVVTGHHLLIVDLKV